MLFRSLAVAMIAIAVCTPCAAGTLVLAASSAAKPTLSVCEPCVAATAGSCNTVNGCPADFFQAAGHAKQACKETATGTNSVAADKTACEAVTDLISTTACSAVSTAATVTTATTHATEIASGQTAITLSAAAILVTGQTVSGTGIAAGTTVAAGSDSNDAALVLSTATTAAITSGVLKFSGVKACTYADHSTSCLAFKKAGTCAAAVSTTNDDTNCAAVVAPNLNTDTACLAEIGRASCRERV